MASVKFAVVDVFSTIPFKGNPLAVVEDLDGKLSDTQMKLITRQFNLSETTFFFKPTLPGATFRLRSFLPDGREVLGIGHNILGIWWFLAQEGYLDFSTPEKRGKSDGDEEFIFHQELGRSVMPVKILRSVSDLSQPPKYSVSIQQATPQAHAQHPDLSSLAQSIGLKTEDIGFPSGYQKNLENIIPRVMSTASTHHLLVPIASAAALSRVTIQRDQLLRQLKLADERAYGIFFFTPDNDPGKRQTYHARFFSPGMSTEDPATGSAAGPLSVFLRKEGYLDLQDNEAYLKVWQGEQVGRECLIEVKLSASVSKNEEVLNVDIIGSGVKVSEGSIVAPGQHITF